ncbi:MAG: hypothetical protein KIT27_06490 [Legionellales bacterium]|nr:hypothetical protein [Legionellales bacterium]
MMLSPRLRVGASSLITCVGDQPQFVIDALSQQQSGLQQDSDYPIFLMKLNQDQAITAPILSLKTLSFAERIETLLMTCLRRLVAHQFVNKQRSLKIHLILSLPRAAKKIIEAENLTARINHDIFLGHQCHLYLTQQSTAQIIQQIEQSGAISKWDYIIVGTVDSLINLQDIEQLFRCGRLMTIRNRDGMVPGEAGVFLLFEKTRQRRPQWHFFLDSHGNYLNAIKLILRKHRLAFHQLDYVLLSNGTETIQQLEWFHYAKELMGENKLGPRLFFTGNSVGHLGTANFSLLISAAQTLCDQGSGHILIIDRHAFTRELSLGLLMASR